MPYKIILKKCWNITNKKTKKIIKKCLRKVDAQKYIKNNPDKKLKLSKKECYQVVNKESGKIKAKCSTEENAKKQLRLLYSLEKKQIGGNISDYRDKIIILIRIIDLLKEYQSMSLLIRNIGKGMYLENDISNKMTFLINDMSELIKIYKKELKK